MHIKKANLNDGKVLSELGAKTFYDTFRQYQSEEDLQEYIRKTYTPDVIAENLTKEPIQYFIAFEKDKPVGYSKLIKNETHEKLTSEKNIELEKIYVLREYLDKKVGKALMIEAINFSKQNGFETLFLGVWRENKRALDFYKKFGFESFTTRTFQLGKTICDDFLMKLEL